MLPLQRSKHKWYLFQSASLFIVFLGACWSKGSKLEWAGSELEQGEWAGREGVWSWKANTYQEATITENISLWEGVWSWKANTYKQATITENIFHFGRCWADVVGNGHRGVCCGVLTTCRGKLLGAHHLVCTKGHSPHSQLGPLTPSGVSIGIGLFRSTSIFWGPHLLCRQLLECPPPLL